MTTAQSSSPVLAQGATTPTDEAVLVEAVGVEAPEDQVADDVSGVVVCSFYTDDDYYRAHAEHLRRTLDRLGLTHHLAEVHKPQGQDWADICRKKIAYLHAVCEAHPDKKVFWIDVDCSLLSLPGYVADFSADLIGFQRGFSSPLTIGYGTRTRFWEPCFVGINSTPGGRKFVSDAMTLEQTLDVKATDDYFFEESWRTNAASLSFQVIPSAAVLGKAAPGTSGVVSFFTFGSSGNVDEFKSKVAQHQQVAGRTPDSWTLGARRRGLRLAKRVQAALPAGPATRLRQIADRTGVTHVLTNGGFGGSVAPSGAASPHRTRIVREMVGSGQRGDLDAVARTYDRLQLGGIPSAGEIAAKRAADSFAHYASLRPDLDPVALTWWSRPFPGNFGDWLSPLAVAHHAGRSVSYTAPTARLTQPHLIAVGSIGRFIKPSSIVVGTGVSSLDLALDPHASYVSVRGPLTARLVEESGGPPVGSWGDPGVLLSRLLPVERTTTNGRVALVRHFTHANVPLSMPDTMDELSVLLSHPASISTFVETLNRYDAVVTSAMHVMIACHSYGIPCALVTFEGMESSVHGSGMKYRDYSLGAGLSTVHEPVTVPAALSTLDLDDLLSVDRVSQEKLDEVEQAILSGIDTYLDRTS